MLNINVFGFAYVDKCGNWSVPLLCFECVCALVLCRDFVSDFELMMQRKKDEMKKRRRRRRDVDIINDNDDLIDDLIRRMMEAAEVAALAPHLHRTGVYSLH